MGFVGRVFGSPSAAQEKAATARDTIGLLTEPGDDAGPERASARQEMVGWMKEARGQNVARRLLAIAVVGVWLGIRAVGAALAVVHAEDWSQAATSLMEHADGMGWEVVTILLFYFGSPHADKAIDARKERMMARDRNGG